MGKDYNIALAKGVEVDRISDIAKLRIIDDIINCSGNLIY